VLVVVVGVVGLVWWERRGRRSDAAEVELDDETGTPEERHDDVAGAEEPTDVPGEREPDGEAADDHRPPGAG
jgi:hypothetical protein